MPTFAGRMPPRERGTITIEFALLFPALVAVLFAIIDGGRLMGTRVMLSQATIAAARASCLSSTTRPSDLGTAAQDAAPMLAGINVALDSCTGGCARMAEGPGRPGHGDVHVHSRFLHGICQNPVTNKPGGMRMNNLPMTSSPRNRERGSVAILIAFMWTALFGMAVVAVDFGYLYTKRRNVQAVADAAVRGSMPTWVQRAIQTAYSGATAKANLVAERQRLRQRFRTRRSPRPRTSPTISTLSASAERTRRSSAGSSG